MVDIDGNSTKQESNRNSPTDENENENNETPHQQQHVQENEDAPQPHYDNVSEAERMSRGSPTVSIRSQVSNAESLTIPECFPKVNLLIYPDDKYSCLKCNRVLCYPVQIQACGHRVCRQCYKDITSEPSPKCPSDQKEVGIDIPNIDKGFWNEIQVLEVKCKNHEWGCKWKGSVQDFPDHDRECEYTEVLCVYDCGAKFQQRFQTKHTEKDCPKQFITCPYCSEGHLREDKKDHLEECPKLPLPCPNKCEKKLTIERAELENHVDNECPRTKILCQFENIGCAHRSSREKMPKHYSKETSNHVKLLYDMLMKQEQALDKHDGKLLFYETTLKDQEKRIDDLEKIAHSQLIWRIEDYSRKLKDTRSGNVDTLFSPTFVTSKHGYRLCASVCLNGDGKGKGTHVSIFISILKGQFDSLLKWPFEYRVTFFLLDQNDDISERKHIKFSIKPNPCPENEPFLGKPKMEKNASFGGAKFVKHEDIETGSYIKDDTIFLKIAVDCDGLSEP